ncbi:MAG TPA: RagB/SusD family nutrient uptake outer membrane protein, partial [Salinimicrobium sp.]|nr:RagB/SusD family nutrient uptake outer membrane protein [Salinimicrobium sp.]
MKKLKYILFFAVLSLFGACEKAIDLQPESILTYNGFWESEEAARAAHVGLYATFRDYNGTFWGMGELRSDIWGGPTFETPNSVDLINQNINTTLVPYANWANFYGLMHRINDFLYNIDNITFEEEAEKQHMIGQIYGMRAFVYYTMLKTWGEVPITTEPLLDVNPAELAKPRAPKEEVMALIKSDIERSLEAFGEDSSLWNGKITYWSKAATLTLKGDVYIWSGNILGGGAADFTEAKNALEQVQTMGFSLVPEYIELWGPANEAN